MGVSVGVVTVAVGEAYQSRLPAWARAVAALQRPPDQVTIAVDEIGDELADEVLNVLPDAVIVHSGLRWEHHPQVLVNDAIRFTHTEWICKMDADDLILPHALSPLDATEGDVLMFGIKMGQGGIIYEGVTRETILERQANVVFSGSPFRRWCWEGNEYRDMIFEDWAFWIGCAEKGARFVPSGTLDYEYVRHEDQISERADASYWTGIVRGLG